MHGGLFLRDRPSHRGGRRLSQKRILLSSVWCDRYACDQILLFCLHYFIRVLCFNLLSYILLSLI